MSVRGRPGYSLLEIIVILGVLGVVLGLTGVCFQTMFHSSRRLQDDFAHDVAFTRFYVQFVEDVHVATAARVDTVKSGSVPSDVLILTTGKEETVRYASLTGGGVGRQVRHTDRVVARDRYMISADRPVTFTVQGAGPQQHVSMAVAPSTDPLPAHATPAPRWKVNTMLGIALFDTTINKQ